MLLKQEFFKIDKWYGGKQEWLSEAGYISKKKADKSCGVAAAANLLQYLVRENSELEKLSYGHSKESYIELMIKLYQFLKPRFYGIPTIRKMKKGILNYVASKGGHLKAYSKIWIFCHRDRTEFIKEAILNGYPVLLLTWNFPDPQLKNHWVIVTGWEEIDSEEFMVVSNWGYKKTYSYTNWINQKSLFKGALYFTK
ncbi:MAG: hypothetical protein RBR71_08850 [Gudongella sp.]|nr:hypothetical protein [Gudongella sp.]